MSYSDEQNQLVLGRDRMSWFWDQYAPDVAGRQHPELSPLRGEDLSNSPLTVVFAAQHDVLRDEAEAYVNRLRSQGVAATYREMAGQPHGILSFIGYIPAAEEALTRICGAVLDPPSN